MSHPKFNKKPIQIFPAALFSQRKTWENAGHLLPANTCLLVTDTKTPKQTQLIRQIAQSFRDKGWQVLIWLPPRKLSIWPIDRSLSGFSPPRSPLALAPTNLGNLKMIQCPE